MAGLDFANVQILYTAKNIENNLAFLESVNNLRIQRHWSSIDAPMTTRKYHRNALWQTRTCIIKWFKLNVWPQEPASGFAPDSFPLLKVSLAI